MVWLALRVCVQNTWNFVFKIWKMVEKIQTDVDKQLLVWKMKKSFNFTKSINTFLFLFVIKIKSIISTSVFIFSTISQILKTMIELWLIFYVHWWWSYKIRNKQNYYSSKLQKSNIFEKCLISTLRERFNKRNKMVLLRIFCWHNILLSHLNISSA